MEKRLTNSAMLFSVGFVFMLVCAVGAFFYGVQIGMDKVEAGYEAKRQEEAAATKTDGSPYQQQDLVSFYHTVFSPYREFQNEWLIAMDKLSQGQSGDFGDVMSNLSKLALRNSEEASSYDMGKSARLGDAQVAYIRSLKLFAKVADAGADKAKKLTADKLQAAIKEDKNYLGAVKETLDAQAHYYAAMQLWAATIDPDIPGELSVPKVLGLKNWSSMPLTVKNGIVVQYLKEYNVLKPFYPQDLTARVDDFIASGQAAKMKLQTASAVIDLLLNTDAVRSGDFLGSLNRFYQSELMPQLPFFLPADQ
ncbi:hypothetical protein RB620_02340 [Paenibacillus sp. LHD-117]|uniref:hypothetical protein n=1 Tax=Paenibacillus sp. LHD-117 TaxID=3071412 RepID=UPI0027E20FCA|nr:hypothetical protein [Paenibacillus sp. LHD-117]MDQ6418268.1 hypothetical protein [Paenibacillus sp. LHD-117]